MPLSIEKLSIMTHISIMTFSRAIGKVKIMPLSIAMISTMTLSITKHNVKTLAE